MSSGNTWQYHGMAERLTYGNWLRQRRGVKGQPGFLSQQALASAVGVDRTHIVQIESGRIGTPEYPLRQRIHDVLGTTETDLEVLGIVGKRHLGEPSPLPQPSRPAAPADDELVRKIASLSDEARELVVELVDGIIRMEQHQTDDASPKRKARA